MPIKNRPMPPMSLKIESDIKNDSTDSAQMNGHSGGELNRLS
jgi:hypothetical protein